jgi:hypothetical protein
MECTVEIIKEGLENNSAWIIRAILVLFEMQTEDEQKEGDTVHLNGVGFNAFDAKILTSFAKQMCSGGNLSAKQMDLAKKKIIKYAGQLTRVANGEVTL